MVDIWFDIPSSTNVLCYWNTKKGNKSMSHLVFCPRTYWVYCLFCMLFWLLSCIHLHFKFSVCLPSPQVWLHRSGGPIRDQDHNLGSVVWAEGTTRSDVHRQQAQSHLQLWWLLCGKARIQNLLLPGGEWILLVKVEAKKSKSKNLSAKNKQKKTTHTHCSSYIYIYMIATRKHQTFYFHSR